MKTLAPFTLLAIAAVAALADVPRISHLRRPPAVLLPTGESISVLPELPAEQGPAPASGSQTQTAANKSNTLQERSRLEIVRYVSGEFARVTRVLPGGKNGFRYNPANPINEAELRKAVASGGAAANPGDQVQITLIEFRNREIIVDINGGGRQKRRLRDRIQISAGGSIPSIRTETVGGPAGFQGVGSTLILDFGRPLPDMSPDEVKQFLSPFLDFSRQRSATVDWVSTLAPEFQQAIKERRAIVGMDKEMVIAALGRPERKVRERDEDGLETEDWIYGHPPGKTIFVKFAGEKVISVKEFPR